MLNNTKTSLLYLLRVAALALAYYAMGMIGIELSVLPGFATSIWPPSGLALAALLICGYRLWPGIFIGSFLINVFAAGNEINLDSIFVNHEAPLIIALGASIQALLSTYLIKKFVSFPNHLADFKDVGLILLIGGPLGCVINSITGPTILLYTGALDPSLYAVNFITWWAGDTLGAVIFAPILLLLLNKEISLQRKAIVSSVLAIVFSASVYLFFEIKHYEKEKAVTEFENETNEIRNILKDGLNRHLLTINSIESFFKASNEVDSKEFSTFTRQLSSEDGSIRGVSWNPKIIPQERDSFEREMSKIHGQEYFIKDFPNKRNLSHASYRDTYFPVTYIEPIEPNKAALGFDTYLGKKRKGTLDTARDHAETRMTGRINIVQDSNKYGMLMYHPIYENGLDSDTVKSRRENLKGYIAGVFTIPEMINDTAQLLSENNIKFSLEDVTEAKTLLYHSETPDNKEPQQQLDLIGDDTLTWTNYIDIAGHKWKLSYYKEHENSFAISKWTIWATIISSLLFTGLLSAFLLVVSGRHSVIQKLVDESAEELRKNKEDLQLIFDNVPARIWYKDDKNKIMRLNRLAAESMGMKVSDAEGADTYDLYPEMAKKYHDDDLEVIASGKAKLGIVEKYTPAGLKSSWVRTDKVPFYDSKTHQKAVLVLSQDITKEQHAEEGLQLGWLGAGIGMWDWDITTDEVVFSVKFKKMLGYKDDEIGNKLEEWVKRIHPDDKEHTLEELKMHTENKAPYDVDYRMQLKSGEWRWFNAKGQALWGEDGVASRMAGSISDIHDKKKLLNEIIESNEQLERFAHICSHDLQEPLRMIQSYTELFRRKFSDLVDEDEKAKHYMDYITDGTKRARELITDVLAYSMLDKEESTWEEIDLEEIMEAIKDNYSQLVTDKDATIKTEVLPKIYANRIQMLQLFQNLISNALKFSTPDTAPVVKIAFEEDQSNYIFSIEDYGIGIDEKFQERIFQIFQRLNRREDYEGTGIGLAVCKKIVQNHDGEIWVKSEKGVGTTFYFTIQKNEGPDAD